MMSTDNWPKHPDGRPMKMGEMTTEQRRKLWREAAAKVKADFEQPEMQAQLARVMNDGITRA